MTALVMLGWLLLSAGGPPTAPSTGPDLLSGLASDDWQTWHDAALELAKGDSRVVAEVARAVAKKRVPGLRAEVVFKTLVNAKARRSLESLLVAEEIEVREAAASALGELREARAAPALLAALGREKRAAQASTLARALWRVAPDDRSADAIVAAARATAPPHRFVLLDLVDGRYLRARLTDDERLAFLLAYVLPTRTASVGALDVVLGSADSNERLADEEDLTLLEAHKDEVAELALAVMERQRPAWAALVLGHLKDSRALPLLRRGFLEVGDRYGWETSRPCPLERGEHPLRWAYEQAIEHITGRPIESFIKLTTPEIWSCSRKDDGLYVLYRLKPEAALEMAASRFRKTPRDPAECCTRLELADALAEHLLRPGQSADHLRVLLGRAPTIEGGIWRYPVGETSEPLALELRFADGRLMSSEVVTAQGR